MKRPVTFVLVAALLASVPVFADSKKDTRAFHQKIVPQVVRDNGNRGNDRGSNYRGRDDRGNNQGRNDHGRNDHRGRDHGNDRRNDGHRNDRPDNDRHDNNRRDWNTNRNDRHDDHRNDRHDNNRHNWNTNRNDRHDWNGNRGWDRHRNDWHRHPNYNDNRRHDRRDYARYRFHFGYYRPPHGYHYRLWHRGDHLPRAYYGHSYIVYDWHPYRLYAPPYGYHWVRVGNDVLLTAIATGVVLDVIYDIWY